MKVKKFTQLNENTNGIWSIDKLQKLHDDKETLSELLLEYLSEYTNIITNKFYYYYLEEFWFDEEDGQFNVLFKNNVNVISGSHQSKNISYMFNNEKFEELLQFMNDPELFKNTKKYNL